MKIRIINFLLLYTISLLAYADDSEVFFLKDQKTNANILFLLDNSASMNNVPASGGSARKETILKDAMQTIMFDKTLRNVNVGAATFTNRLTGSGSATTLLTPILDIDDKTDFFDVATHYENDSKSPYFLKVSNKYVKEIPLFTRFHHALFVNNPQSWRSRYVYHNPAYGSLLTINCMWYMAAEGGSDGSGTSTTIPYANCLPKKSTWEADNAYLGFFFDNVTLTREAKDPGGILKIAVAKLPNMANYPNDYINVAQNSLLANTYGQEFELLTSNDGEQIIDIYLDQNPLPDFFRPYIDNYDPITNRISSDFHTSCIVPVQNEQLKPVYCDISALIAKKVKQKDWQPSNGIAIFVRPRNENLVIFGSNAFNKMPDTQTPKLYITASSKDSFKDKQYPQRRAVLASFMNTIPGGATGIVETMLASSKYISNIPLTSGKGPYHSFVTPSPFSTDSTADICQTTYLALMTDGVATYDSTVDRQKALVQTYMGSDSCSYFLGSANGEVAQKDLGEGGEACGRALAYWLANNTHTSVSDDKIKTENVIQIKGIGFDLDGVENGNGNKAATFINDLTRISGGGNAAYKADDAEDLVAAFKNILTSASESVSPTNGQVASSGQNRFKQRKEVFFTFYQAANRDYWLGNMKGYFIDYVSTPNGKRRPVLYGKDKKTPAIISEEINNKVTTRFVESVSTLWSNKDGSIISSGGVLGQIIPSNSADPVSAIKKRKANMKVLDTSINLIRDFDDAVNYSFAQKDKGDLLEDVKKALIGYMQGYKYQLGGVTTPAVSDVIKPTRIGDSARSQVTLVNYGCSGSNSTAKFEDCPQVQLKQIALLASNDGFFRGFATSVGSTYFEILPQEMLPNLEKLYISAPVDGQSIRTYGLDGTVAVYHDDVNKNDYVDGETAYAYVTSGRGGSSIYAFDISRFGTIPKPVWSINNSKADFTNLGKTWSTPVTGKLLNDTPVIIFGGGEAYDNHSATGIYIVGAYSGKLIKYIDTEGSIPSSVSVIKNDNDKIQDIIVGDTRGNVYRVHVSYKDNIVFESSKIASFSGNKKFYHAPCIYKIKGDTLSINIGSGDQNKPLAIDNNDSFYSFHIPLEFTPSVSNNYITEQTLPEAFITENDLTAGFKITFLKKGEKVISDYVADLGQLVFNSYVPPDYSSNKYNCLVKSGKQNSYYINLSTGKSIISSEYVSTNIIGLPSSVSLMSDGRYVTFVADASTLAEDLPDEIEKTIVDLCGAGGCWKKTSWTDHFNITLD